jgi:hypothetical protein
MSNEAKNTLLNELIRLKRSRTQLNEFYNNLSTLIYNAEQVYNTGDSLQVYKAIKACKTVEVKHEQPEIKEYTF